MNRTLQRTRRIAVRRLLLLLLVLFPVSGCNQKMARQPSYDPLEPSRFFSDGSSARQLVPGTVARGHLYDDPHFFFGRHSRTIPVKAANGEKNSQPQPDYVETFPFPVTREVLERGRERFMIFCSACHDPLGNGYGKIVERGFTRPPSYHIDRLREMPVGRMFDVITNGYGAMPDHASQVPPRDRWAIIAYIRVLQQRQNVRIDQLSSEERAEHFGEGKVEQSKKSNETGGQL